MDYSISTDPTKLDIEMIHDFLSNRSYWARGRSLAAVKTSIENTRCFGLYDRQDHMVGFARVLTDDVVFAYVMDVFILEPFRGQGLAKFLLEHIFYHAGIHAEKWMLITADAHSLYEKFGFQPIAGSDRYLIRQAAPFPVSTPAS